MKYISLYMIAYVGPPENIMAIAKNQFLPLHPKKRFYLFCILGLARTLEIKCLSLCNLQFVLFAEVRVSLEGVFLCSLLNDGCEFVLF